MTFDVFGDFGERGYLRNFAGVQDPEKVKRLEHRAFLIGVEKAIDDLAGQTPLTYASILTTHKTLFGSVYPWAGQDRLATAPGVNISRGGYDRMFAFPKDIRRATDDALKQGNDPAFMRDRPGEVMGSLAHAHPFLDGNGRTIMTVHTVLAARAGISIAWEETDKTAYLTALTQEVHLPGDGHLDAYLKPFVRAALTQTDQADALKTLRGLGPLAHPAKAAPIAGAPGEPDDLADLQGAVATAAAHLDGAAKAEFLTRAADTSQLLQARSALQARLEGGESNISLEDAQKLLGPQAEALIARARATTVEDRTAQGEGDSADVPSDRPTGHRP